MALQRSAEAGRDRRFFDASPAVALSSRPMPIRHVSIVSVPVSDPDRSIAFFRDKLGFVVLRDSPMGPNMRWVQVAPPGALTSLTLVTWFDAMPPGSVQGLLFNTDDIDGMHASLTAAGVAPDEVKSAPWGRYFTFKDPDGNGYVLQQDPS